MFTELRCLAFGAFGGAEIVMHFAENVKRMTIQNAFISPSPFMIFESEKTALMEMQFVFFQDPIRQPRVVTTAAEFLREARKVLQSQIR